MSRQRFLAAYAVAGALSLAACGGASEAELLGLAKASLEKQDVKAAVIQLKNALQKNPQSADARLMLGRALLKSGDPAGALVELRKAQELQAKDDDVLPDMAQAMLMVGEEVKLIAQYAETELKDNAARADFKTSLATAYAVQGNPEKALHSAELALQALPGHAPALIVLARLRAVENDLDGALSLLDKVLAADPANERAGVIKGDLLLQVKRDPDGALAVYRQVLTAHPASVAARTAVTNILLLQKKQPEAKAEFELLKKASPHHPETLHLEAQFAFADKDYKRTREIADQILKAFPNNVRVLELAGAAEFRLRNYLPAEAMLAKALKLAPQQGLTRLLLAQTYLRTGEPAKTLDVLKPVIETGKADGTVLSLAGEAYLQLGDARRSEEAFAMALKASPQDSRVRTSAALAQIARGNAGGAISELEAVAAGDGGPRADLALVSARLRQNDLNGALKAIDGLEKKMPDQALPLQLRGRVLTLKNDLPGAVKSFEAAMAKEPAYFPPVASLAALDLVAKKPEEARKRFNAYIQAQPKSWQARLAMAELDARTGAPPATVTAGLREAVKIGPAEPRPHLLLVNHLIGTGDAKAALQAAQDAAAALPNNYEIMDAQGRAEVAAGDNQRAVSTFKKLASLQPRNPLPELRLADAYVATKDLEAAGNALRRAAQLQPGNVNVQRAQARLAMLDKRPDDALKIARDVQQKLPKDALGHNMEAEVEASRQNWAAAQAAYRASLQRAKTSETTAKLHTVLMAAGKAAEAERLSAEWTKANPKDAAFLYYLGDLALAQKKLDEAEARYRAVLEVQPENALAMNNVAWLLASQRKPGAVALAEKADALLPNRAPILDTLALALEADNQLPKAVEAQKRAVALAPKDPGMSMRLAKLYIKAGDKTLARNELEALSRLGDKFTGQAEVATLLKSL
ncbi:MAG: PEP-CTERM system TPR-repeat protein PrsT [Leptothrix sp. (in: Bacteria)]|nr:PEP-CTERM system TPR-repeat protein PrsT [Leptothrix sp. (in: b-proteobacteria)]